LVFEKFSKFRIVLLLTSLKIADSKTICAYLWNGIARPKFAELRSDFLYRYLGFKSFYFDTVFKHFTGTRLRSLSEYYLGFID